MFPFLVVGMNKYLKLTESFAPNKMADEKHPFVFRGSAYFSGANC